MTEPATAAVRCIHCDKEGTHRVCDECFKATTTAAPCMCETSALCPIHDAAPKTIAAPRHECFVGVAAIYVTECKVCGDVGTYKTRREANQAADDHEEKHG